MAKRGYFKQLMYDFCHLNELMPSKINIYNNDEEGIFAYQIRQPKNQYCPSNIDYFEDNKKGIFKLRMDNEAREICQSKKKLLVKKA